MPECQIRRPAVWDAEEAEGEASSEIARRLSPVACRLSPVSDPLAPRSGEGSG